MAWKAFSRPPLRCIGGQFQGRLLFRNADEKARAARWGVTDLNRKYELNDLARGNVMFAATGVTTGNLLRGVRRRPAVRSPTRSSCAPRAAPSAWSRLTTTSAARPASVPPIGDIRAGFSEGQPPVRRPALDRPAIG